MSNLATVSITTQGPLYSFNDATIALHDSLGFQLEGRIRRAVFTKGQYFDELLVGITAEEFAEKHAHKFS